MPYIRNVPGRVALAIALLTIVAVTLTGCGGDDDVTNDDERVTEVVEAVPTGIAPASPTTSPTPSTPPTATEAPTASPTAMASLTPSPSPTTTPPPTPSATATLTTTPPPDLYAYESVCDGGRVTAAPAYDRSALGPHPILIFIDVYPGSGWLPINFPEGWIAPSDDPSQAQLVACVERTQVDLAQVCEGYGTADRQDLTVELYDATYNVTLREAQTGQELHSTTFLVESGECPMLAVFEPNQTVSQHYANPSDNLKDFVAPYVMP
jgi:hypothetical protein